MRPEKIGKYEKLEQIGHGSSATVWRAQDTILRREVALKVIETEVAEPDRLFEESRIVVKLGEHPHIARVFDADVMNGLPVVVMEYVKGTTLEKRLNAEGKFSIDESLRILAQILLALEAAHNNRVLHNDIKPANILLDSNGQVKVTDFGLSQTLASHGYMQGTGTYEYMAPEDFSNEPATDIRKDIWSVGVILYRMLTGTRPYVVTKSKNPSNAWEDTLKTQTPRPLSYFLPNAPAFLQGVVNRALHKDKHQRFQSSTAFLDALKSYGLYKLYLSSEHYNRFLNAFSHIVNHLRTVLNISNPNVGVPLLIDEYKNKYPEWKQAELLEQFRVLRNYLAHPPEPGEYKPLPSLRDIETLEAIEADFVPGKLKIAEPLPSSLPNWLILGLPSGNTAKPISVHTDSSRKTLQDYTYVISGPIDCVQPSDITEALWSVWYPPQVQPTSYMPPSPYFDVYKAELRTQFSEYIARGVSTLAKHIPETVRLKDNLDNLSTYFATVWQKIPVENRLLFAMELWEFYVEPHKSRYGYPYAGNVRDSLYLKQFVRRMNIPEANWKQYEWLMSELTKTVSDAAKVSSVTLTAIQQLKWRWRNGKAVTLTGDQNRFHVIKGGELILTYEVNSTLNIDLPLWLGACLIPDDGSGAHYNQSEDAMVTVQPGRNVFSRSLTIWSHWPNGSYRLARGLWHGPCAQAKYSTQLVEVYNNVSLG